jgi:hypothetical protein
LSRTRLEGAHDAHRDWFSGKSNDTVWASVSLRRNPAEIMSKARILTMPALPDTARVRRSLKADLRYIDGQRLVVEAIRYLVRTDPKGNLPAVELLSRHFRTKFRMSDKPELLQPQP